MWALEISSYWHSRTYRHAYTQMTLFSDKNGTFTNLTPHCLAPIPRTGGAVMTVVLAERDVAWVNRSDCKGYIPLCETTGMHSSSRGVNRSPKILDLRKCPNLIRTSVGHLIFSLTIFEQVISYSKFHAFFDPLGLWCTIQ